MSNINFTENRQEPAPFSPGSSGKRRAGLALIGILAAIGAAAILAGAGVMAWNPPKKLSEARDKQRREGVEIILNAVRQRISDNEGVFEEGCAAGMIPSSSKKMASGAANYNIAPCLVPTYIPILPYNASADNAHFTSADDYDSGYCISQNPETGAVTVNAPSTELGEVISVTQ